MLHSRRVVLFKVHHFSEKLPAWERGRGNSDCGGFDGKCSGRNSFAVLNSLKASLPEATAGFVCPLMGGAEGEAVDVSSAALTEDGDDVIAENFPDSFSSGSWEVSAGKLTGVGGDHRMSGVLKKHGDSSAGPKAVRYQNVDPWNGWPLPVDAHEDMAISSVD